MEGRRKRTASGSHSSSKPSRPRHHRGSPDKRTPRVFNSKNGTDVSFGLQPVDAKVASVTPPSPGVLGGAKSGFSSPRTNYTGRVTPLAASTTAAAYGPRADRLDSEKGTAIVTAGAALGHDEAGRGANALFAPSTGSQSPVGSALGIANGADSRRSPMRDSSPSPRRPLSSSVTPVPWHPAGYSAYAAYDTGGFRSCSAPSPGSEVSEMRRTDALSPRGSALVAAASAVASFAPFVPAKYDDSTSRADGGVSRSEGATSPNTGEPNSQLPYGSSGWSKLRRRLSDVEILKRLVDLLSHLDCFWLAQDLCSGDSARMQSSFRVVSTMALLLLVLWLAVVPNSADKSWRASSVGLLVMASLTMNLVAAPMASLLPFLCMPLLDLADARAAALPYSTVRQMSFLCAMLLVLTMEECGLSTRLALLILSHTGHKINSILALVIAVAVAMACLLDAFSVTVLMMSTVECIVDEIYFHIVQANLSTGVHDTNRRRCPGSPTGSMQRPPTGDSTEHLSYFTYRRNIFNEYGTYVLDERNTLFKAMMAAVVYGSNIGSGGTSRGSQQGYYLLHFLRQTYTEATTLNYFTWTAYSAPSVVASAVFLWWHLCRRWVPSGFQIPAHTSSQTDAYHVKYEEMKKLGFKPYEAMGLVVMVAYVNCSLVSQDWINITDESSAVRSETVMVGLTTLAFMAPSRRGRGSHGAMGLVSADVIQKRMPWGVFLLAGAGCAMSLCFQLGEVSALNLELVSTVTDLNPNLGVALLVTLGGFLVEMQSSDNSVLHIMAPMASMADERQWNPLLLLLPTTKLASTVFLLPVSCYGNALLFDYARMSCWEMIAIGFPVKIVTIILELVSLVTVGNAMFDLEKLPAWATKTTPLTTPALNASTISILNVTSAF